MGNDFNKRFYLETGGIPGSPVFFQPWWLDIVCQKGQWDLSLVQDKAGKILGIMPYFRSHFLGFSMICTPPFTPYLGVWLDYSQCSERNVSRYGFENEVITALIKQLPKTLSYHQIHPEQLQNWLPFYWQGFRQTTRYTYVFEQMDMERIFPGIKDDVRNKIRKAEKSDLTVRQDNDLDKLVSLLKKTFSRQKMDAKLDCNILAELHSEITQRNAGAIFFAENNQGEVYAGLYLVWDNETAYCWQLGADTELRKSGAVQFLLWHTIQETMQMGKRYNFEGSMLPHIEPVFRAFGAERRPVFQIRKFGNRFLEAAWVLLKGG